MQASNPNQNWGKSVTEFAKEVPAWKGDVTRKELIRHFRRWQNASRGQKNLTVGFADLSDEAQAFIQRLPAWVVCEIRDRGALNEGNVQFLMCRAQITKMKFVCPYALTTGCRVQLAATAVLPRFDAFVAFLERNSSHGNCEVAGEGNPVELSDDTVSYEDFPPAHNALNTARMHKPKIHVAFGTSGDSSGDSSGDEGTL
jgi:hypothetical protein